MCHINILSLQLAEMLKTALWHFQIQSSMLWKNAGGLDQQEHCNKWEQAVTVWEPMLVAIEEISGASDLA